MLIIGIYIIIINFFLINENQLNIIALSNEYRNLGISKD